MYYPRLKHVNVEENKGHLHYRCIRKNFGEYVYHQGRYKLFYYGKLYFVYLGNVYCDRNKSYLIIYKDGVYYFNNKYKKVLRTIYSYMDGRGNKISWEDNKFFEDSEFSLNLNFKSVTEMRNSLALFKQHLHGKFITI